LFKRVAFVSTVLLTFVSPMAAQQPADPSPIRSGVSLVALSVSVTDTNKHFVGGLKSDDFAVYEDGVQQQVRFFESSEVPIDLIVLLDTSSSMGDKMDVVREAASGFLRTLRSGDRGAVLTFNDGVEVAQPLTSDRASLERAVRQTQAKGATALHNAIYVALKAFGRRAAENSDLRRQAIAVLSDGEDTSSLISFDDVMDLARKSGVGIYTIGLQTKQHTASSGHRSYSSSQYSMKTLAKETGAEAFFPTDVTELHGVYSSIAQELSSQYSIAYTPTNPRPDGRFRRIVVRIVSRPELRPKSRTGYTAEVVRTARAGNALH
jgi:Ca-activated chloride channel family protein